MFKMYSNLLFINTSWINKNQFNIICISNGNVNVTHLIFKETMLKIKLIILIF